MPKYRVTERAGMLKHDGYRFKAFEIIVMVVSLAAPLIKSGHLEEVEEDPSDGAGTKEHQELVAELREATEEALEENEVLTEANEAHLEAIRKLKVELRTGKGQFTKLKKELVAVKGELSKLYIAQTAERKELKKSTSQVAKLKEEKAEAQVFLNGMKGDLKVALSELDKFKAQAALKDKPEAEGSQ